MLADEKNSDFVKEFDTFIERFRESIVKGREEFVREQEQLGERMGLLETEYRQYQSRETALRQEASSLSTLSRNLDLQIADVDKRSQQLNMVEQELLEKIEKIGSELTLRKEAVRQRLEERTLQTKESGPEIQLYEKRLGLFIRPTARDRLLEISFIYIDPVSPLERHGIHLKVLPKTSPEAPLYTLDSAYPAPPDARLRSLMDSLNEGQVDFYRFLKRLRAIFKSRYD